jgi:hypothetical protein
MKAAARGIDVSCGRCNNEAAGVEGVVAQTAQVIPLPPAGGEFTPATLFTLILFRRSTPVLLSLLSPLSITFCRLYDL